VQIREADRPGQVLHDEETAVLAMWAAADVTTEQACQKGFCRFGGGRWRSRSIERCPTSGEPEGFAAIGGEAVVANAFEARG
jgi:hypothetical protein